MKKGAWLMVLLVLGLLVGFAPMPQVGQATGVFIASDEPGGGGGGGGGGGVGTA